MRETMRSTNKLELIEKFQRDLDEGRITRDGKLQTLRALAANYQCSPAMIKRIVDQFVARGVLRTVHGVGTFMVQGEIRPVPVMRQHIGAIVLDDQIQVELKKAREYCMDKGWAFSIYNASSDEQSPAREKIFLNMVRHQEFAAVIMEATPIEPTNFDSFVRLRSCGIKVIHTAPYREDMSEDCYFMPDFYAAGQITAGQLARYQYSLAIICHNKTSAPFLVFWRSGIAMMAESLEINVTEAPFNIAPEKLLKQLRSDFSRQRLALICANADLAQEFATAAEKLKLTVPGDFGIIALSPPSDHGNSISYVDFDYSAIMRDALHYATNPNVDSLTLEQKKYLPFYVDCHSL